MGSSCFSALAVCRNCLGLALEVELCMWDWCTCGVHRQAQYVQCAQGWAGAGKEHSDWVKTSLLLSPSSSCGHSSSPSKHPSIQHLLPSKYNPPDLCVLPPGLRKCGLVLVFACEINTWDGICLTEYWPLKSQHFWSWFQRLWRDTWVVTLVKHHYYMLRQQEIYFS